LSKYRDFQVIINGHSCSLILIVCHWLKLIFKHSIVNKHSHAFYTLLGSVFILFS